jgi:hypothetical protein
MDVENPIISATLNQRTLTQITDRTTWEKLAQRYTNEAKLDAQSIALIKAKQIAVAVDPAPFQPRFHLLCGLLNLQWR